MRKITACRYYMRPDEKAELDWLEFDGLKETFVRLMSARILEAEGQGIESVTSIRCMKHKEINTMNRLEGKGECPICAMGDAVEKDCHPLVQEIEDLKTGLEPMPCGHTRREWVEMPCICKEWDSKLPGETHTPECGMRESYCRLCREQEGKVREAIRWGCLSTKQNANDQEVREAIREYEDYEREKGAG